jgi:hypothetical protein
MSAPRKAAPAGTTRTTRLRKVSCPECGYTVRMARSWMTVGLPSCPCGNPMQPESPADLAWCGLIGPDDMPLRDWNAICRENGWEIVLNHGQAARRRELTSSPLEHQRGAVHCAYPGCGRWIAEGADRCTAGHSQSQDAPALEATPF